MTFDEEVGRGWAAAHGKQALRCVLDTGERFGWAFEGGPGPAWAYPDRVVTALAATGYPTEAVAYAALGRALRRSRGVT